MDSQPPIISSFVIRFVLNDTWPAGTPASEAADGECRGVQDEPSQPSYRGSIRHIQSDEELHFHLWEDAVEFIRRYVPLGMETGSEGT